MNIDQAFESIRYAWPSFLEVSELVFFEWCAPVNIDLHSWHDRVEVESTLNHVHILDLFENDAALEEEPFWNEEHPDYIKACQFGLEWVDAIAAKLHRDFPNRNFRVYYTKQDNPIVRFHQVHAGEPNWLEQDENSDELKVVEVNAL